MVVTEWTFSPGAETGWHTHAYDYVVIPQMKENLLLESKDGSHTAGITTEL